MGRKIYIAHRGLHDKITPENSMPAFAAAMAYDMSIEFDVQLTKDEKVVVFHDKDLKRMTGINKRVSQCSYEELKKLKLASTLETIPLLEDVLKLVGGKVFLDIEIKHYSAWKKTVHAVRKIMQNYRGSYSIKSFNPIIPYLYKKECPDILCGVLVGNLENTKLPAFVKKILLDVKYLNIYKPDFVAYNVDIVNPDIINRLRQYNIPLHLFTLNTMEKLKYAQQISDTLIVENITKKD